MSCGRWNEVALSRKGVKRGSNGNEGGLEMNPARNQNKPKYNRVCVVTIVDDAAGGGQLAREGHRGRAAERGR
eukprot:2605988-Prymnesium_polylepis.2